MPFLGLRGEAELMKPRVSPPQESERAGRMLGDFWLRLLPFSEEVLPLAAPVLVPCTALTWVSWEQDRWLGSCSSEVWCVGRGKSHLRGLFLQDLSSSYGVPHGAGAGAFVTSRGGALGLCRVLGRSELDLGAGRCLPTPLTPAAQHSRAQVLVIQTCLGQWASVPGTLASWLPRESALPSHSLSHAWLGCLSDFLAVFRGQACCVSCYQELIIHVLKPQ